MSSDGPRVEDDGQPDVVDFDALNAALGALPPPSSSTPMAADSEGRSSATYSSARPHTIPPSVVPNEDINAPAVIVASDETIPSGPPAQMTMPMSHGIPSPGPHPAAGMPPPMGSPQSPPHPFTPQPFPQAPVAMASDPQMTVPMIERPRRPRSPTIVVRTRGPSKSQKVLVFLAMLIVFVGGGIAFLIFYPGLGLNLLPNKATAPTTTAPTPSATPQPSVSPQPPATSQPSVSSTPATVSVGALPSAGPPASATSATPPKKKR